MRIVFNTRFPSAAASSFYKSAIARLNNITFFDWRHYQDYDIALFMTYTQDLLDLQEAKKRYPKLKVGLIDPRGSMVIKYLQYVDFMIVDSIEMKDYFDNFNLPIFLYYEYPDFPSSTKEHEQKEKTIIGYHGNKLHLMGMYPNITRALSLIALNYDIEFWAIYNIKMLGKWTHGVPANVPVNHFQWEKNVYTEILSHVDIGIVPNLMPINNINKIKKKAIIAKHIFNDLTDDYLLRFKMTSNPGRIITFGKLGIPVISDMYPSALQSIKDGINGYLSYSTGGWYHALENLIMNYKLRQYFADNMRETIKELEFEEQNINLLNFLYRLINDTKHTRGGIIENPLDDLSNQFPFMMKYYYQRIRNIIKKFIHVPTCFIKEK